MQVTIHPEVLRTIKENLNSHKRPPFEWPFMCKVPPLRHWNVLCLQS